jgi:hypothetical protein
MKRRVAAWAVFDNEDGTQDVLVYFQGGGVKTAQQLDPTSAAMLVERLRIAAQPQLDPPSHSSVP